jgi:pimeloyl-ACP methyl ester carboxylesterase
MLPLRRAAAAAAFAVLALTSSAQANMLTDAPSQWAKGPAGLIHYKTWGRGSEALVFIHGWTCDMTYFGEQVPHFADRMRVITIDLPGHGASDKPDVDYTQALFAESVRRVLDDAHVKRAVLVGHSMGMSVARQFYRTWPKRTLGIVSLDGSVKAMITDQKTIDKILASLKGPGYLPAATMMVDGMLANAPETPYKAQIRDVMLATPQKVVASAAAGMFDLSLWNDDPIKVPVLLLHAKSAMWNADYEKYAHTIIPNLDYRVLEGVSHFLHTEKPEEVNMLIDGFLVKNELLGQRAK